MPTQLFIGLGTVGAVVPKLGVVGFRFFFVKKKDQGLKNKWPKTVDKTGFGGTQG